MRKISILISSIFAIGIAHTGFAETGTQLEEDVTLLRSDFIEAALQKFQSADINNDGILTRKERGRLGGQTQSDALDMDNNHKISQEEYLAYADRVFSLLDTNSDNRIAAQIVNNNSVKKNWEYAKGQDGYDQRHPSVRSPSEGFMSGMRETPKP